MAILQSYYRIITPVSKQKQYSQLATDSQDFNRAGGAAMSTISWYSQIMKGAGSRFQRYIQYDSMDNDVDIARALDVIAEEISNDDDKTNLPFLIEYQTEDDEEISESVVTTLRAAVRHWGRIQDLNNRIFRIARIMCKYGDCFFQKKNDTGKWEYLDPSKVIGIELDKEGNKVAYHLKGDGGSAVGTANKQASIEIAPTASIVHFTLSDEMGEAAPFGESILQPIFRTFKQLSMLEDSVIVYRIVRAPERRVFYIDVGNMPQQRVKMYLENIRNELRQKRIPNTSGDKDTIDGTYNPACLDMETRIPLLDGRVLSLNELMKEHFNGKQNWAYSCHPETGEFAPGLITWAGVTRKNANVIKLTLDNGSEIIVTPDHQFPIQGKGFVKAEDLTLNDSFFPFNIKNEIMYKNSDYQKINTNGKWQWTHQLVSRFMKNRNSHVEFIHSSEFSDLEKNVIHHVNFDRKNNNPDNLVFMNRKDHKLFHRETKSEWWANLTSEMKSSIISYISEGTKRAMAKIPLEIRNLQIEKAAIKTREYHKSNKINPSEKYKKWIENNKQRFKSFLTNPDIIAKRKIFAKTQAYKYLPTNQELVISQEMFSRVITLIKNSKVSKKEALSLLTGDKEFMSYYKEANSPISGKHFKINLDKVSDKLLKKFYKFSNTKNWKQFKSSCQLANHKIVSIETVENRDVGCITIDGNEIFHNYHTFALESGIFTKNSQSEDFFLPVTSSGRSSRIEVLPGGENLGELSELKYFRDKIFRGLRIPSSYFPQGDQAQPAIYNDGKVGIAYQEELRFANYVRRLQNKIESVMDTQFKLYLDAIGLNIEDWLFILRLPEPQNFAVQRQLALDTDLINTYKSIEDSKVISARYKLKRYLGFTEDELQMNEKMLKEELNIDENANVSDLRQIYDPVMMEGRQAVKVKPKFAEKEESSGGGDSAEPGDNMDIGGGDTGLPPEQPGSGGDLDMGGGSDDFGGMSL